MKHIECAGSNPSIFTAVYCVVICALLARGKPYPCMQGLACSIILYHMQEGYPEENPSSWPTANRA